MSEWYTYPQQNQEISLEPAVEQSLLSNAQYIHGRELSEVQRSAFLSMVKVMYARMGDMSKIGDQNIYDNALRSVYEAGISHSLVEQTARILFTMNER